MKKYNLTKKKLFNTYGAAYTSTDLILTIIGFCISIGTVCYIQKLNLVYSIVLIVSGLCMIPIIVTSYYKYKYEKKHFEEYCLYFENVKMFFKVCGKLVTALEETSKLFDEKSEMKKYIELAIEEIKNTGDYQYALTYIDEKFHNTYLDRLHSLLITGEKHGGESVYYNLDKIRYQDWKEDVTLYQNKKKSAKYIFYFIACLSIGTSIYSSVIYSYDESMMNLLINTSKYQLYTFVALESMLLMFIYIYTDLINKKWIRSDE